MPSAMATRVPSAERRESLARALRRETRAEVRFDDRARALYATDASNYRMVPIGVVIPRDIDDVVTAMRFCREDDAPVLARGGGTSLAGQCCNVAVVFDFTKYMHRILALDPDAGTARVQPGIVLDTLRGAAERHALTFAPDPSTHASCSLGGMIGNNSCGVHSLMAGKTEENVESLSVLTYDGVELEVGATPDKELDAIVRAGGRHGEIYASLRRIRDGYAGLIRERFPDIPRRVSGYNLNELLPENGFHVARALVGTEGTCALTLEAKVRLVESPPGRAIAVVGYADVATSADHVPFILEHAPIALEGFDDVLVEDLGRNHLHERELGLLPEGWSWLVAEFGGRTADEAVERARAFAAAARRDDIVVDTRVFDDAVRSQPIFEIRESGLGATARVPGDPDTWEGWEDAAVPPDQLGGYLRDFRKLLDAHGLQGALYGHFGQGCVHTRIDFDMLSAGWIAHLRRFVSEAADLVVSYGGSLSGEHGDGQSRAELLPKMFGDEIVAAFGEFEAAWDPANRMNPGKVVDPLPIGSNPRLGTDHVPPVFETRFRYPGDETSFPRAVLRCVGVGNCRKTDSGTMCPSYMVTHEEKHSTRGRARLLFELMRGDVLTDLWRSEDVHDALDLCLACKACRSECPVRVDVATYKAEFLSHYYAGRRRGARDGYRGSRPRPLHRGRGREATVAASADVRRVLGARGVPPAATRAARPGPGALPPRRGPEDRARPRADGRHGSRGRDPGRGLLRHGGLVRVRGAHDVSMAIGERVLLPKVRAAPPGPLLVAQGFSCREQIAQATGREPLHLAQVVRMAMDGRREVP